MWVNAPFCMQFIFCDVMQMLLLGICNVMWFSVADEDGIHILDDGNFYYEVVGLPEVDPEEELFPLARKPSKVKFSTSPMKVLVIIFFVILNVEVDQRKLGERLWKKIVRCMDLTGRMPWIIVDG